LLCKISPQCRPNGARPPYALDALDVVFGAAGFGVMVRSRFQGRVSRVS